MSRLRGAQKRRMLRDWVITSLARDSSLLLQMSGWLKAGKMVPPRAFSAYISPWHPLYAEAVL